MGRPLKEVSAKAVRELAKLGCSLDEIGHVLGCDASTISRRFANEVEQGVAELRIRLRRRQLKSAFDGNTSLLIFLGKVILKQHDERRTEIAAESGAVHSVTLEEINERILELLNKAGYFVEPRPRGSEEPRTVAAPRNETEG